MSGDTKDNALLDRKLQHNPRLVNLELTKLGYLL